MRLECFGWIVPEIVSYTGFLAGLFGCGGGVWFGWVYVSGGVRWWVSG